MPSLGRRADREEGKSRMKVKVNAHSDEDGEVKVNKTLATRPKFFLFIY